MALHLFVEAETGRPFLATSPREGVGVYHISPVEGMTQVRQLQLLSHHMEALKRQARMPA